MHQLTPNHSAARALYSALILLACSAPGRGQAPTDTWLGATGNWSVAADWFGGTAPPSGGGNARILQFLINSAGYTSTNDRGAPFQLNGLRFDGIGTSASTVTIANAAGSSLQFAGTNPFVLQNTGVNAVISAATSLSVTTSIGGSGYGTLTLSGPLSGGVAAGLDGLVIDGTGLLPAIAGVPGGSVVTLSSANTFTGNVELGNANLALGTNTALGATANQVFVNAASNSLRFSTTGLTIPNAVTVNGTLTFAGSNAGTLAGVVGGAGGLTIAGSGILTLTAANNISGSTTVGVPNGGAGGLTLSAAGSLTATNGIVLGGGSTLALVNTAAANSTNRIADSAPITFQNGRLSFTSAPLANTAGGETFGPVNVQGGGTITVTAASQIGTSSVLQFGALSRTDNGTLFIQNTTSTSQTVGGGPAGPNRTNIFFSGGLPTLADPAGAVGGQNAAIVPFLSGSMSGTATNVMGTVATYDANGVRLLNPTDPSVFAQASSVLTPHANNNLYGFGVNVSGTTTVTSLVGTANGGTTVSGSGTIQVSSGVVVAATSLGFSGPVLAFGGATGYLHLGGNLSISPGSFFSTDSSITGSGGLVVSSANGSSLVCGPGNIVGNPFTGGLYVNGNASVSFTADNQLGAAGQPITLNGGTLNGASYVTVNRTINLGPGGGSLIASNGPVSFAGTITGTGGLTIAQSNYSFTISGANSYTGPTTVNGNIFLTGSNSGGGPTIVNNQGFVEFADVSNFSAGPLILNGGTIYSQTSGTIAKDVTATSPNSTFSVAPGQTVTYTGHLSGGGTLNVRGGGTLVLVTANPALAGVTASGSTVVLTGPTSLPTAGLTANAGGFVRLDDAGGSGRLGPASPVSVQVGGELRMDGATAPTAENFGALATNGTITVVPGSGVAASLNAASLAVSTQTPPVLFRGTNLGGSAAESAHINVANLPIGTVILNAMADTSATGTGQDQAVYGTAGIRPAVAGDFTSGPVLQNGSPTNTLSSANFRVSGAVTTADSTNSVRSLRLEPGATLAIPSGTLSMGGGFIYAAAGGASTIAGPGTLQTTTAVLTQGDLNVSATLANESLGKYGPGKLTLSGPANFSSLNVKAGTLVLNNNQQTSASFATITSNLVLATPASGLVVSTSLSESPTTFISGPGSLTYNGFLVFVDGANTYSGGTFGGPNAEFLLFHPSALGTGPVTLTNTNGVATFPTTLLSLQFGVGTFANDVNLPTSNSTSEIYGYGPATLSGRIRGGNAAAGTAISFSGSMNLSNPNNDFTATVVAGFVGTVGITSNSVLGNAANAVSLDAGTIQFNADGIVLPRQISVTTSGGTFDTGNYHAQVSSAISGPGDVTKQGAGTLILSGANTFTGDLRVYQGLALVTGSLAPETTGFWGVLLEGTLGGTGTLTNRTVTGFGGTIAPGLPTATGKLTIGSATDDMTLAFRIDGPSPGDGTSLTGYDRLVTTGTGGLQLSFTGLNATVGNGFDPTIGNLPIFIIDDQATTAISGTFTNLPNGALVNLGGFTAHISYFGNTATNAITGGNDVVLYSFQAIPEPSSLLFVGAAAVGFAQWRRRRHSRG